MYKCVAWMGYLGEWELGFRVQGSRKLGMRNEGGGFAAFLDDGILVSSAFPSRGRCPEGADRVTTV